MNDLEKNLLLLLTTKEPLPSTGEILEYRHGDVVVSVSQVSDTVLKVWPNADLCGCILAVVVRSSDCAAAFAIARCKAAEARRVQLEQSANSAISKLLAS